MALKLVDRRGRPYTPMMDPDLRRGRRPPNYGQRYPPEVYSHDEVLALLAACGRRGPTAVRNRAMIVVLYRTGLRIAELLALGLSDVDLEHGTVKIRHGKGDRHRVVGIDSHAGALLELWLAERRRLQVPAGRPLFCTISQGRLGHAVRGPYFRNFLKRAGRRAGLEKRIHPHGFRHTHAVELLREGFTLVHIQKQLGHSDLATTARYLDHLMPLEVVELVRAREWPGQQAA